jgi:hypothetical protein
MKEAEEEENNNNYNYTTNYAFKLSNINDNNDINTDSSNILDFSYLFRVTKLS